MSRKHLVVLSPIIFSTFLLSVSGVWAANPSTVKSGLSGVESGSSTVKSGSAVGDGKAAGASTNADPGQPRAKARSGVYIIDFPSDAKVAELTLYEPNPDGGKEKERLLMARGRVVLPANCTVGIDLSFAGPEHMASLEQIDAGLVREFSAAKLEFDDAQLAHIRRFTNLHIINLAETNVSEKSLPLLGSFHHLKRLTINTTDITGSGFDAFANSFRLTKLSMEGIKLQHGSLAKLKPLAETLLALNVARTGLTNADMENISDLHAITHLDLSGNNLIDDRSIKYLHSLPRLVSLDVTDTSMTDKSFAAICSLPKLEKLVIRGQRFWTSGKPIKPKGKFKIKDCSKDSKIPVEMFSPLH